MFETFYATQGSSVRIDGTLKDADGHAVTGVYTSANTLTTTLWPGGPTPASFVGTTTWDDPNAGTFHVEIDDTQTAALYPGVYQGITRLADGPATPDAYYFTLVIASGPGGIPAAPTSSAITRLVLETDLVDENAALLLLCGKSTTADGANRALGNAAWSACATLGYVPAIPGVVTDADLAAIPLTSYVTLKDLTQYYLLKNLLNSFAQPDQTSGNNKIQLDSMMQRFRVQMSDLQEQYGAYLGNNRNTLSVGTIRVRPAGRTWAV